MKDTRSIVRLGWIVFFGLVLIALAWVGGRILVPAEKEPPPRETAMQRLLRNRLPEEAMRALAEDGALTLYSIEPEELWKMDPRGFHGWRVLGKTTVADAAARAKVAETVRTGMARWNGAQYACFSPRHALRAHRGGWTFDFLICFECGYLYYYPPQGEEEEYLITAKPDVLNDILQAAKVPLAQ
jgi:hypothetical protein